MRAELKTNLSLKQENKFGEASKNVLKNYILFFVQDLLGKK